MKLHDIILRTKGASDRKITSMTKITLPAAESTLQWCKIVTVFELNVLIPGGSGNQHFHQDSLPFQKIFGQQQISQKYDEVECILCCNWHHGGLMSRPLE